MPKTTKPKINYWTMKDCCEAYGYTQPRAAHLLRTRLIDKGETIRRIGYTVLLTERQFKAMKPADRPGRPRRAAP